MFQRTRIKIFATYVDTSFWRNRWPSQDIAILIHLLLFICRPHLIWRGTWRCREFPLPTRGFLRISPLGAKPGPANARVVWTVFMRLWLSAAPSEFWSLRQRPHRTQTRPLKPQLRQKDGSGQMEGPTHSQNQKGNNTNVNTLLLLKQRLPARPPDWNIVFL